jgi:hypothetical protein
MVVAQFGNWQGGDAQDGAVKIRTINKLLLPYLWCLFYCNGLYHFFCHRFIMQ